MELSSRCIKVFDFTRKSIRVHQELGRAASLQNLNEGEVLIKVAYAPVNPLDILKIDGAHFGIEKQLPLTPGSECSGTIELAHEPALIGRKVSALALDGSWRTVARARLEHVIFLKESADLKTSACGFVNPVTALGLVMLAECQSCPAVVNMAAGSSVGQIVHRLGMLKQMKVINVVRGQKNFERLKTRLGCQYILDSQEEEFIPRLKILASDLDARASFDPIGGFITGKVLNCLPPLSRVYNFGTLDCNSDIGGINASALRN